MNNGPQIVKAGQISRKVIKDSYIKWEADAALTMIIRVANTNLPDFDQVESGVVDFLEAVQLRGDEFFHWIFNAEFLPTFFQPDFGNPWARYLIALSWRETLREMVKGKPVKFPRVAMVFDSEGKPHVDTFLWRVLEGRDVPNRLRECPICNNIFWAWRKDAQQCGNPTCKTRLSSKKFYDKPENKKRVKQYYEARKKKQNLNRKPKRAKTALKLKRR